MSLLGEDSPPAGGPVSSDRELRALEEAGRSWSTLPKSANGGPSISPDLDVAEARGDRLSRYVRVVRSKSQGFERVASGWLQTTPRTTAAPTGFGRFRQRLRTIILGRPLATSQLAHERLTKVKALAVLSSDALSSVAYASEQLAFVFLGVGVLPAALSGKDDLLIMGAIAVLLIAVVLSYRQTIKAYPQGGGSYIVAKDNLGPLPGLIAASALMTDYVLTVAVSISSGVSYLTGVFTGLKGATVAICLACILLMVLGNLRGIRESGTIFAAPTYVFIFSMLAMLGWLAVKILSGQCSGTACVQPAHLDGGGIDSPVLLPTVGIFLILQAFASGCSAITGVEAISDGVLAFKKPEWRNARITLMVMGALLCTMFIGVTLEAHVTGQLGAIDNPNSSAYEPLVSKLAADAFGSASIGSYVVIGATMAILVLAANTAFSDFPRLFFFLSRDNFAPHQFRRLGDRLAFSNGIVVLGVLAGILVFVFNGDVSRLIPLYAIGVFLAFTMSQGGMVKRWWTRKEPGWRTSIVFNAVGMCLTAVVFLVFTWVKFREGAWVVCIIIPAFVALFYAIHRHYTDVQELATIETPMSPTKVHPVCIVPLADMNPIALQSLAMARTVSETVIAVHVCDDPVHIERLREKWEAWGNHVPLEIIESPYRSFLRPLLSYLDAIDRQSADKTMVIVLPELVATRWWHNILHNQTALRLKAALLFRPGTVVINVPYHLARHQKAPATRPPRAPRDDDPEAI